jgi:endonuclease-3 related protein
MKRRRTRTYQCRERRDAGSGRPSLRAVYRRLAAAHGPQHWWPGDSRFEIMVGAVLTQNTAWTNVERAIANLKRARALTPEAIVAARHARLAKWLKPSGYFNIKARRLKSLCRWLIAQGGVRALTRMNTQDLRTALIAVHGIGPETADDIVLYAFDRPVFVIDAYTRRIFARLGLVKGDEGYETLRHRFENTLDPDVSLFNEYHALIVRHGKDVCRKRPRCGDCCLLPHCGYGRGQCKRRA